MGLQPDESCLSEDVEIYREVPDDYYSPSIHKTKSNRIGINCGGFVFVKSAKEWHELAKKEFEKEHGDISEYFRNSTSKV